MLLIPPFNYREGTPSVRIGYYGLKIPAFTKKRDVFSYTKNYPPKIYWLMILNKPTKNNVFGKNYSFL